MKYFTLSGILRYRGEGRVLTFSMALLRQRLGQIQTEVWHPICKTEAKLVFSNACMTNKVDIVLVRFPSQWKITNV